MAGHENKLSAGKRLFIASTIAAIALGLTWRARHADRNPGSVGGAMHVDRNVDQKKRERLEREGAREITGKATGSFGLTLSGENGAGLPVAESATQFRLHGTVTATRNLAPHEFTWILPPGYSASSASLSGRIPALIQGQTHELTITVQKGSRPPQPVVLHVYKLVGAEAIGQIAQYEIPSTAKNPVAPGAAPDKRPPTGSIKGSVGDGTFVQ